jgi:hypothetical protein
MTIVWLDRPRAISLQSFCPDRRFSGSGIQMANAGRLRGAATNWMEQVIGRARGAFGRTGELRA